MKRLFVFTVCLFCLISTTLSQEKLFSLSGVILESKYDLPAENSIVSIKELSLYTAVTVNGYFELDSIPSGTYEIEIYSPGYLRKKDTILFNQNIEKDYIVECEVQIIRIEQTDEMRKYHFDLRRSAKNKPVMELIIDSLEFNNGYLYFYSTFKNNTQYPIYILRANECIKPFWLDIYNSKGEIIKASGFSLTCDQGFFGGPNSSDLIEIPPYLEFKYPKTIVWSYNFKDKPKDKYLVGIGYEYSDPLLIRKGRTQSFDKISSKLHAARIGLRGFYFCKERKTFFNK